MSEYDTLIVKIDRRTGGRRYRQYYVRTRICDSSLEMFELPLNIYLLKDSDVGYLGHELVLKLNEVDGIEEVYLSPFCLGIGKNPAFDWEDIEADILFSLETVVGKPVEIKRA